MAKKPASTDRRRRIDDIKSQQKKAERRTTLVFVAIAVLVAGGLIASAVIFGGAGDALDPDTIGVKKVDAACAEVKVASTAPGGEHVTTAVSYPEIPPIGGDHNSLTAPSNKGFYDREDSVEVERLVHNLEHGYVVAWYDKQATGDDLTALRQLAGNLSDAGPRYGRKFIVAPYTRGDFEGDANIGLSAWGSSQLCGKASGEAIKDFVDDFRGPNGPKSVAPEKANA